MLFRSAYDLYLVRSLKNAELLHAKGADNAFKQFVADNLDALAGLRPRLITDHKNLPGSILLEGRFTAVQQAAGVPKGRSAAAAYLAAYIEDVKASGLVAQLIEDATAKGIRQMIAVIGDSANAPSIELHRALGFRMVGNFENVGYKFGRWLDSVMMQRALGEGASTKP